VDPCSPQYRSQLSTQSLRSETDHSVGVFQSSAPDIFGSKLPAPPKQVLASIYSTTQAKDRFLSCAMTHVAVQLYGGPGVDTHPHDEYFHQKYSFLLTSPWASSHQLEREVVNTLGQLGRLIGPDKRLEVLFTSALMRGFGDQESEEVGWRLVTEQLVGCFITGCRFVFRKQFWLICSATDLQWYIYYSSLVYRSPGALWPAGRGPAGGRGDLVRQAVRPPPLPLPQAHPSPPGQQHVPGAGRPGAPPSHSNKSFPLGQAGLLRR